MLSMMCINFNAEDVESIKTLEFCGLKGVEYTRDQLNGMKVDVVMYM